MINTDDSPSYYTNFNGEVIDKTFIRQQRYLIGIIINEMFATNIRKWVSLIFKLG